MTTEVAIKMTADGRAVVVEAKKAEQALQGVGTQAGKTGAALQGASRASEGLEAGMRGVEQSARVGGAGLQMLANGATMAATAVLAAGAALGAGFVGKLVAVQREFDVLNSSLVTVSGSSAKAAREMEWLKRFAKETPFGLAQAVDGFVKMKALGLDPTRAALTSFGNTASAMGKDLNQMVEAVADATTGEFERLKEFGIKAKQEGDRVSLTFQGVTTNIGNNAAEINQYLINIGNNEFGGAMIERAKTLDGVISGLSDSWDELFRTIASSGVSQVMIGEIQGIDGYLGALTDQMTRAKESGAGMVMQLSTGLGYVVARAPFDVLSVSANALNGTINALTGGVFGLNTSVNLLPDGLKSAAQHAALAGGELETASRRVTELEGMLAAQPESPYLRLKLAETRALVLELQRAKTATDALEGRSGSTGSVGSGDTALARAQRKEWDSMAGERAKLLEGARTSAQKLGDELDKARKAFDGLVPPGVEAAIRKKYATATAGAQGLTAAEKALAEQQKRSAEVVALRNKLAGEAFEAQQKLQEADRSASAEAAEAAQKAALSLQDQVGAQRQQNATIGLTREAVVALEAAQLREQATSKDRLATMADEIDWSGALGDSYRAQAAALRELAALKESGDAKNTAVEQAREADTAWKAFYTDLERGLTDSLFRAFESGKGFFKTLWDGIRNLFKTTVLKLAVQAVVGSVTGMGAANAATGGGGLTGLASNVSSLYSGVSSLVTLGSQVVAGTMSVANALGTVAANATGTGITGLLATNGAYGTAAAGTASATAGGAMSALAAIPGWGWAAMAAVAVASIFGGRGQKESTGAGIEGQFGGDGFAGNTFSTWKQDGGWFHRDRTGKDTGALDAATTEQFSQAYQGLRSNASQAATALGLSADAVNRYSERISVQLGSDAAANEQAIAQLFSGLGDRMALAAAPGLMAFVRAGETAGAALVRLSTSLTAVNTQFGFMGAALLDVSLRGADAASALLDAMGGLEAASAQLGAYYDNYYSEAEKTAHTTRALTTTLGALGLVLPETREGFRALVEAQDLTTERGRTAYATLMQVQDAFATLTPSAADLAEQAAQAADAFADLMSRVEASIKSVATAEQAVASAEQQARIDAANATNAAAQAMGSAAQTLWGYVQQQTTGAQDQFADVLRRALGGDVAAMQDLPSAATASNDAARAAAKTAAEYAVAKAKTMAGVNSAAMFAQSMSGLVDVPQAESAMASALRELSQALKAMGDDVSSAIGFDLVNKLGEIDANGDLSISLSELSSKFDGLASEETLSKLFASMDLNGDGQISLLEAIKSNTGVLGVAMGSLSAEFARLTGMTAEQAAAIPAVQTAAQNLAASNPGATAEQTQAAAAAVANLLTNVPVYIPAVGTVTVNPYTNQLTSSTPALASAQSVFQELLGRNLDPSGAIFYAGMSEADVRAAVLSSPEYLARTPAFALGGVFTNGIVNSPTLFNMGLMGEAGAEAIMPLTRGPGGALGVQVYGAGAGQGGDNTAAQRELLAEIKRLGERLDGLNREVARMRQENNIGNSQIADSTDRAARLQERWNTIGLPATEAARA